MTRPVQFCAWCSRPLPEGMKSTARFCSPKCKTYFNRAKKKPPRSGMRDAPAMADEDAARLLTELAMTALALQAAVPTAPVRLRPMLTRISGAVVDILAQEGVLDG